MQFIAHQVISGSCVGILTTTVANAVQLWLLLGVLTFVVAMAVFLITET